MDIGGTEGWFWDWRRVTRAAGSAASFDFRSGDELDPSEAERRVVTTFAGDLDEDGELFFAGFLAGLDLSIFAFFLFFSEELISRLVFVDLVALELEGAVGLGEDLLGVRSLDVERLVDCFCPFCPLRTFFIDFNADFLSLPAPVFFLGESLEDFVLTVSTSSFAEEERGSFAVFSSLPGFALEVEVFLVLMPLVVARLSLPEPLAFFPCCFIAQSPQRCVVSRT